METTDAEEKRISNNIEYTLQLFHSKCNLINHQTIKKAIPNQSTVQQHDPMALGGTS